MPKLVIVLYIIGASILGLIIFSGTVVNWFSPQITEIVETLPVASPTQTPEPTPSLVPIDELKSKSVFNTVPFVLQAPLGEWSDPKQQDACEESSVIMAMKWVQNEPAGTPSEQKEEILKLADWQTENFGDSRDTSASDTLNRLIKNYYSYQKAKLETNITSDDIIRELHSGNLVIAPMNGQALNNPYFTQPGPERHMVLVTGYNADTNEFITNDPGIGRGENYRYPVGVFDSAIRDYSTGYHIPIEGNEKNIIVIQK